MALAIIPLIVLAGIGIDTARGFNAKGRLQSALDSAALAGGRAYQDEFNATAAARQTAALAAMNKYFAANFPPGSAGLPTSATITPTLISDDGTTMTVKASLSLPTLFMGLLDLGKANPALQNMNISAVAKVERAFPKMELVFVVDNTGSQYDLPATGASAYNRPMERLRRGMRGIVNDLFDRAPQDGIIRVGVVPFWHSVNVKNETILADNRAAATAPSYGITGSPTYPNKFAYLMDRSPGDNNYRATGTWPSGVAAAMKNAYTNQAALDADFAPTTWRGCVESTPSDPYVNSAGTVVGSFAETPPSPMRWWPYLFSSTFASNTSTNNSGNPKAPATACRINQCPSDADGCADGSFLTTAVGGSGITRNDWVDANTTCWRYTPATQTSSKGSETALPCISDGYETAYYNKGTAYSTTYTATGRRCEINSTPRATSTTSGPDTWGDANAGPNFGCDAQPILPLSGHRGQVLREIDNLKPSNAAGTHGDVGIAWSIRLLSPLAAWKSFWGMSSTNAWPVAWNSSDTKKVVVMVLDNGNDRYNYGYYGYPVDNRLGSTASDGSTRNRQNALQLAACTYLKSQGVSVYTIVMTTTDSAVISMMQQCATQPSMAQSVENAELENALDNVRFSLMNLHLSQ